MDPPVSRTDVDLYRANEEAAKIEVKSESTAAETNVDLIRENPSQEDQAKAAGDAHATSDGQSNGEKGEQKAPNGEASDKESKVVSRSELRTWARLTDCAIVEGHTGCDYAS